MPGNEHETPWRRAIRSGSLASVLSTLVVSWRSRADDGAAASGTNAASQWVWGRPRHGWRRLDLRHTAVGYLIHHSCSVFWALWYERWNAARPPRGPLAVCRRAAATAALACAVDYLLTPPRFRPGFERHLTRRSMVAVYATFGLGLALGSRRRRRTARAQCGLLPPST